MDLDLDKMEAHGATEKPMLELLYQLVRSQHVTVTGPVLELGIYQGDGSESMVRALRGSPRRYIGVDRNRAHCNHVRARLHLQAPSERFEIVAKDAITFLEDYRGPKFGFVFIDDTHEKAHVVREIALCRSHCAVGALITGHDTINYPTLAEAFVEAGGQALVVGERGLGVLQV
jgi:predicted O-methyltransferase YrrM